MSIKSTVVFLLIFSLQLFISCINPCDCEPGIARAATYIKGEVTALDTSGFNNEIVTDSVHRNAFGLKYISDFTENEIVEASIKSTKHASGFSPAMACSCVGDRYTYDDPVIAVSIFIIDDETQAETDGNLAFGLYGYTDLQNLNEVDWNYYFNQEWYPQAYLEFELIDEDAVAPSSVFKVVLTLESGATLVSETVAVKFFD